MLVQRLFYGALLIAGLVLIFWGDYVFASASVDPNNPADLRCGSIIPLAVLLLAVFGTLESLNLARAAGYMPMGKVVLIGVVVLNVIPWLVPAVVPDARQGAFGWELIIFMLATMVVGVMQVVRHRTERGIGDISVSIMILAYMGILLSMVTALRASLPGTVGTLAVLQFVAVVKCTDIGAYFTGRAIGKTKLIPAISPGKTVEGLAGGLVLAIVVSVVLARTLPWHATATGGPAISSFQAVLFGALIAMIGQLGDLVESVFKRDATSKDSGNVIPAFGGILDLLDSPAFAAPIAYLFLSFWLGGN
jgi:phosphatidate cytidylyltransferase